MPARKKRKTPGRFPAETPAATPPAAPAKRPVVTQQEASSQYFWRATVGFDPSEITARMVVSEGMDGGSGGPGFEGQMALWQRGWDQIRQWPPKKILDEASSRYQSVGERSKKGERVAQRVLFPAGETPRGFVFAFSGTGIGNTITGGVERWRAKTLESILKPTISRSFLQLIHGKACPPGTRSNCRSPNILSYSIQDPR